MWDEIKKEKSCVYARVLQIVEVESAVMEGYMTPYPYVEVIELTCTNC